MKSSLYRIHDKGLFCFIELCIRKICSKISDIFLKRSKFYDDVVHIAFAPIGGLGDYIISAKILEELQDICTCEIDVFCDKKEFGQAIYGNRRNVYLRDYKEFDIIQNKYDLGLFIDHFVRVRGYKKKRVSLIAPVLAEKIELIQKKWIEIYPNIYNQAYRECIQFHRCKVLGLNRWTELRMAGAFSIANQKVYIPLQEEYKLFYEKQPYSKKRYITVNCSADTMRSEGVQTKIWNSENYEKLIDLVKMRYSDLQIIQIGDANSINIRNVNYRVLGESLELTKWIIKNSEIHIDCEGGLVHLATQLGTKCIVLFGPTPLHMYSYEENINLVAKECNSCMGIYDDWAYKCYRGCERPICMMAISPELVMDSIINYLG